MNVYQVRGNVTKDGYVDNVVLIEGLEEKPKTYVKNGTRIEKNRINQLEKGILIDSYQVHVLNENEIPEARAKIKEKIVAELERKWESIIQKRQRLAEHSLNQSPQYKNSWTD